MKNLNKFKIVGASKYQNITPLLKQLPWLLIKKEIGFKVKTSTFKCLNDQVPAYLNDLIKLYIPSRYLRSSNQSLLKKPKINYVTFGRRSFRYFALLVWNKLNNYLKQYNSLQIFNGRMKTFLFDKY